MKKTENRESSIPTSFEQIDRVAYEHLQSVRRRTRNNFNLEAAEFAQDAALKISTRQAAGVTLAEDLVRDGKRKAMQSYNPQSRLSKSVAEFLYHQEEETPQMELKRNFETALNTIKKALTALTSKQILALYLKITGQDNAVNIARLLKVSSRQYRNYILDLKYALHSYPGFKESFLLLLLHAQERDLMQYLISLIKEQLTLQSAA
ncbi:MAG: hypothetical protein ACTHMI_24050 [Mucilaginibacter sp.]